MAKSRKNRFSALLAKKTKKRRKRSRRRYRSNPGDEGGARHNPPLLTDVLEYALPGFGGFALTKFVANAAASQIAKRWPKYAKHAGAVSSLGTFAGAWYLGHRLAFFARYHTPIVVGSGIATLQNLVQIYFPEKVAWLLGSPKHAALDATAKQQALLAQSQNELAEPALPDHLEEVYDDPSWYTFNDAYDAGRYKGGRASNPTIPNVQTEPLPTEPALEDETWGGEPGLFAHAGN
jgi:hypothetical protein